MEEALSHLLENANSQAGLVPSGLAIEFSENHRSTHLVKLGKKVEEARLELLDVSQLLCQDRTSPLFLAPSEIYICNYTYYWTFF